EARRRAWSPNATSMEAFTLKVLGGWEVLKSDVTWAYFHAVGREGPPAKSDKLPAIIRQVAEICNDHVLPSWERELVLWWFDDWGDPERAELRAGQLRVVLRSERGERPVAT